MNLEELKEQMKLESQEAAEPVHHLVIFLPFLRMKHSHSVAGLEFLPLRDADGKVSAPLSTAEKAVSTILSGYIDRHGEPFDNCVVATIPGRGWDLTRADGPTVMWAASLLFLSSWACNEYFPRFGGPYVNASTFRVTGQGFTGDVPVYIAVVARRRDGSSWDGGYKHGEFMFNAPVQCSVRDPADVDEPFLAALDKANAVDSPTMQRLRSALPFVQLGNTDDDILTEHAEAILMGSAFEQLLKGDGHAYTLGKKFGELFQQFGSVTVTDAQKARPDIEIDTSDPARAAAQPTWWVHRKWMEELYDVRSKMVHEGHHDARKWGWTLPEHLVMAAFVFSLAVKLLLAQEGHYTLTNADEARCLAVDKLLASTGWDEEQEGDNAGRSWHKIVSKAKWDHDFQKRMAEFLKEHPGFFQGEKDADPPST